MFDEFITIPGVGELHVVEEDATPTEVTTAGAELVARMPQWTVERVRPQLEELRRELATLGDHKVKAMAEVQKFAPEFQKEAMSKALAPQRKVVESIVEALEKEAAGRLEFADRAEAAHFAPPKTAEDGTEAILNEMRRREVRDNLRAMPEDERFRALTADPGRLLPIFEADPVGGLVNPEVLQRVREQHNAANEPEWLKVVKKQAQELAGTYGFVTSNARRHLGTM